MAQPIRETTDVPLVSLEDVRTGDVLFMNRKCLAMKDPVGIGLCLLTKTENRFDHVGMFVKLPESDIRMYPEASKRVVETSPSGTYVLETNMKGVSLFSAEQRISRSSANEMATRRIVTDVDGGSRIQDRFMQELESMYSVPYQTDLAAISASVFSPPDKMDRIHAAHKINALQHEIDALTTMSKTHTVRRGVYERLAALYKRSQVAMLELYFPHLPRAPVDDPTSVDWSVGHYCMDGVNQSPQMVCSELVCNLWQRVGLINGFVPASSMRPFDLMDDSRFNFISLRSHFGHMAPVKLTRGTEQFWRNGSHQAGYGEKDAFAERHLEFTENARVAFYNELVCLPTASAVVSSLDEVVKTATDRDVLPASWLIQSNSYGDVVENLWYRVLGSGLLFAACAVPCAPLTLRWVEAQVGLFLVRGSPWSLACGIFARDFTFVASQAAAIGITTKTWLGGSTGAVMGPRSVSELVDTRHPYYTMAGALALSSLLAHIVTTPLTSANLAHHFGPQRPGPIPLRTLSRGMLLLSPFSVLLPLQAFWLAWYETVVSFIVPVPSSVLRPRTELLERPSWSHFRNDALVGAFAGTLAFDLVLYPAQVYVARRFMQDIYRPRPSPSFGRRYFPGYRYRFVSNVLILSMTTCILHGMALI